MAEIIQMVGFKFCLHWLSFPAVFKALSFFELCISLHSAINFRISHMRSFRENDIWTLSSTFINKSQCDVAKKFR